jgi:hypothetical protein
LIPTHLIPRIPSLSDWAAPSHQMLPEAAHELLPAFLEMKGHRKTLSSPITPHPMTMMIPLGLVYPQHILPKFPYGTITKCANDNSSMHSTTCPALYLPSVNNKQSTDKETKSVFSTIPQPVLLRRLVDFYVVNGVASCLSSPELGLSKRGSNFLPQSAILLLPLVSVLLAYSNATFLFIPCPGQ